MNSTKRPDEISITIKLINKPNTIGMGWADCETPIIKTTTTKTATKKKRIGSVSATIGAGMRVTLEKNKSKEYSVYCFDPLQVWDAVQIALNENNKISK